MFKMLFMVSPLILRTCTFSSGKVIEHTNQIKSKLLNKTKLKSCSSVQYRSFACTPSPESEILIKEVNYEQLMEFINQNEALIIDVRTKKELAETGILPNSYNIPIDELNFAFQLTPDEFLKKYKVPKPDKNKTIIFSCAKGIRSYSACDRLKNLGYKNLFNYTEGWYGWVTHK